MAQTPVTTGAMEGVEAPPHTEAQPASARYLRNERPPMGVLAQGYWRIAGSKPLAVALPNRYWADLGLQGFHGPYRRFREC
jgi:hypothetical protein